MAIQDPGELDRIDREIRINELKCRAEAQSGGELRYWESEQCPPEIAEQFWESVVDFEAAPWTTLLRKLAECGRTPPPAALLTDSDLCQALEQLIGHLAEMRVFLENTNHLGDRELYELLTTDLLLEETKDIKLDEHSACHIDLLGGCSDEDIRLYLKYYADEEWRQEWVAHWPEETLPPHEDPPFDRDRH
jgi:hypothetical protein